MCFSFFFAKKVNLPLFWNHYMNYKVWRCFNHFMNYTVLQCWNHLNYSAYSATLLKSLYRLHIVLRCWKHYMNSIVPHCCKASGLLYFVNHWKPIAQLYVCLFSRIKITHFYHFFFNVCFFSIFSECECL